MKWISVINELPEYNVLIIAKGPYDIALMENSPHDIHYLLKLSKIQSVSDFGKIIEVNVWRYITDSVCNEIITHWAILPNILPTGYMIKGIRLSCF